MAIDLKAVQRKLAERKTERDRKIGQRDALISEATKDYGVTTLKACAALIEKEAEILQQLQAQEDAAIADFTERFPGLL